MPSRQAHTVSGRPEPSTSTSPVSKRNPAHPYAATGRPVRKTTQNANYIVDPDSISPTGLDADVAPYEHGAFLEDPQSDSDSPVADTHDESAGPSNGKKTRKKQASGGSSKINKSARVQNTACHACRHRRYALSTMQITTRRSLFALGSSAI